MLSCSLALLDLCNFVTLPFQVNENVTLGAKDMRTSQTDNSIRQLLHIAGILLSCHPFSLFSTLRVCIDIHYHLYELYMLRNDPGSAPIILNVLRRD